MTTRCRPGRLGGGKRRGVGDARPAVAPVTRFLRGQPAEVDQDAADADLGPEGRFARGCPLPSRAWMVMWDCDAPSWRRVSGLAVIVQGQSRARRAPTARALGLLRPCSRRSPHSDRQKNAVGGASCRPTGMCPGYTGGSCPGRRRRYCGSPQSAKFTLMRPGHAHLVAGLVVAVEGDRRRSSR